MGYVQTSKLIPAKPAEVFSYITHIENAIYDLEPHMYFEMPAAASNEKKCLEKNDELDVLIGRFGIKSQAKIEVTELKKNEVFAYRLLKGFFSSWQHRQTVQAHDHDTTLLTDLVDFRMRLGLLGAVVDDLVVRRDIEKVLNDRLERIEAYFMRRRET